MHRRPRRLIVVRAPPNSLLPHRALELGLEALVLVICFVLGSLTLCFMAFLLAERPIPILGGLSVLRVVLFLTREKKH